MDRNNRIINLLGSMSVCSREPVYTDNIQDSPSTNAKKPYRAMASLSIDIPDMLDSTRANGRLCDIRIKVGDKHVFAHKAVLAIVSPYFHTMFTGGFREGESPQTEVDMTDVFKTVDIAETVIKSFYTGTVEVTATSACELIMVYDFLMVLSSQERFKKQLVHIVKETLSLDTCLDYWVISQCNSNISISDMILDLLQHRFHDYFIYQFDKIFQTFSFNDIRTLFKQDVFKFCTQDQVLEFLSKWLLASGPSALDDFQLLVKEARISSNGRPRRATDVLARRLRLGNFEDVSIIQACQILWTEINEEPFVFDHVDVAKILHSNETNGTFSSEELEDNILFGRRVMGSESTAENVVIGVAPSKVQKSSDTEDRLTVYAYLQASRLWLEIGTFFLPESVSYNALFNDSWKIFSIGQLVYILPSSENLLIEIDLLSRSTSHIPLPARGTFVACLQDDDNLYSISKENNTTRESASFVIVFRLTCGQWKRMRESKLSAYQEVVQSWVDTRCIFILLSSNENYSLLQISTSSPQIEHFISVQNWPQSRSSYLLHYPRSVRKNSLVLHDEDWHYIIESPPSINVITRIPRKMLQPSVQAEKPDDSFPTLTDPMEKHKVLKGRAIIATDVGQTCLASYGSSLFLITYGETDRGTFTESILGAPTVVEHPPPPCDRINAISCGTLDTAVLLTGKPARYTHQSANQKSYRYYFDSDDDYYDDYRNDPPGMVYHSDDGTYSF